ncbi:MAG: response regulator, partial [Myxococcota bacterium]
MGRRDSIVSGAIAFNPGGPWMAGTEQLNVLVVDDDEGVRRLLVDIIQKRDHQVVTVDTAEKGLELLPVWTFQIAFLDHNLPGMEGLLLGEYLRRSNPDMTIALVTGTDDPRLEKQASALSLTFIPKPFAVNDILRLVDEYVSAAKKRDAARHDISDLDFVPPIARYKDEIGDSFGIPKVPNRIEGRIVETVKRCLQNLRSASRYTERERVVALSGLLSARVLGIALPRTSGGRTLYEEYDHIMVERGRRREFGHPG